MCPSKHSFLPPWLLGINSNGGGDGLLLRRRDGLWSLGRGEGLTDAGGGDGLPLGPGDGDRPVPVPLPRPRRDGLLQLTQAQMVEEPAAC